MSTRLLIAVLAGTVGLTGLLLAGQQVQEDPIRPPTEQPATEQLERRDFEETTFREGKKVIHRASALIGMDVQNSAGRDLGDIHDLTLDQDGKVQYVAVSFGGFLGIGDKLFAVPWEAIEIKRVGEPGERGEWVALMEVTEQELEQARGFDKDNWPDMADERWRLENDRAFRTRERTDTTLRDAPATDAPTTIPPRR